MPAPQVTALREHVEQTKDRYPDPAERDRALERVGSEVAELQGVIETYRGDARMQLEAAERSDRGG